MTTRITNVTAVNCRQGAIHVEGNAAVDIDGLTAIDTPVAVSAAKGGRADARNVVHHPDSSKAPEEIRRKYVSGHSFAKGDHLKK